jgi:hypothetical protein
MDIFASAGFDVFSSDTSVYTKYPAVASFSDESLSRASSIGTHGRSRAASLTSSCTLGHLPSSLGSILEQHVNPQASSASGIRTSLTRTDTLSPSSSDVRVLAPDLTCIGLADDASDVWSLKIIKLVAYPELISSSHSNSPSSSNHVSRIFCKSQGLTGSIVSNYLPPAAPAFQPQRYIRLL